MRQCFDEEIHSLMSMNADVHDLGHPYGILSIHTDDKWWNAARAYHPASVIQHSVMAGLVPAIHVFGNARSLRRGCPAQGRA